MSDNETVSESVEHANRNATKGFGIDYKYSETSGTHTLTLRNHPEVQVKTTVTERALLFVSFYISGQLSGATAAAEARDAVKESVDVAPEGSTFRRSLNKLLGRG